MGETRSTETTYYTKTPAPAPGEYGPSPAFCYFYDGAGNAMMALKGPSGSPVAIASDCPTGIEADIGGAPTR